MDGNVVPVVSRTAESCFRFSVTFAEIGEGFMSDFKPTFDDVAGAICVAVIMFAIVFFFAWFGR